MTGMADDQKVVCYSPEDYAGFWRRTFVEFVDLGAVALFLVPIVLLAAVWEVGQRDVAGGPIDTTLFILVAWALSVYGYLVVLKRSRIKTLGYRLARVRVVDIHGRPPGLGALSLRFLFSVFGPFNILLDLLWIPSDRCRQSLRDKAAHTYVVRAHAQPVGEGRVIYRQYYLMGWSLVFQEVEPAAPAEPRAERLLRR